MAKDDQTNARVKAIMSITSMFGIERYIYIGIIVVSFVVLLISVSKALFGGDGGLDVALLTAVFGSGGMITVMTGRLIHMWDRAMNLIETKS